MIVVGDGFHAVPFVFRKSIDGRPWTRTRAGVSPTIILSSLRGAERRSNLVLKNPHPPPQSPSREGVRSEMPGSTPHRTLRGRFGTRPTKIETPKIAMYGGGSSPSAIFSFARGCRIAIRQSRPTKSKPHPLNPPPIAQKWAGGGEKTKEPGKVSCSNRKRKILRKRGSE